MDALDYAKTMSNREEKERHVLEEKTNQHRINLQKQITEREIERKK